MPFKHRLFIISILTVAALAAYGIASYYSASLVAYVVEQALLQKLPADVDPQVFHGRLHNHLSSLPDRQAKLEKLLAMSQYMEKQQRLSIHELEQLLKDFGHALPAGN